jgi:NAD(P)-dependent dehydrogenase (short-subunit alcohol dehydrogenase family)
MKRLANKVALVTGASRGIGRAIAVKLASEGALVAVHYNSAADEADQTLEQIERAGGVGFTVSANLAESSGHRKLADAFATLLKDRNGSPSFDILVNNAGVDQRGTIEHVTEADFDRMVQINLKAPFFLIQSLLPSLNAGGRIINVSSMGARASFPTMPVYAPTKAALSTLSRILAVHLGPRAITVNAVSPGATATDMNAAAKDPEMSKAIAQTIALGRVGQPEDIARVVAFLASEEGGWITGETIDVSGGQRL